MPISDVVEVSAVVSAAARVQDLEPLLLELSPSGWLEEGPDAPPGDRPPPPSGHTRLTFYLPPRDAEAAARRLRAEGAEVAIAPLDPAWQDRWKAWFKPFRVSERLSVAPPWDVPKGPGATVVIEPGFAFGTGQHETTLLCLEAVDADVARRPGPPAALLDVGSGSGILAIAARLLGVPRAVAIDVDPDAVAATLENAGRNGVTVEASTAPLAHVEGPFPLVVANILAPTLIELARPLAARLAPGGRLHLSGILATQGDDVRRACLDLGLRDLGTATRGEWVRLDLEAPAP